MPKSQERSRVTDPNLQGFNNKRLKTPGFTQMARARDGGQVLKDQIKMSNLRIKAVKFGHSVEDIEPEFKDSFYLPSRNDYIDSD